MPERIGALHPPHWPPESLPRFAQRVEAQGFDELWLAEDCFFTGGLTTAATALAVTERIVVGTGLLPTMVRSSQMRLPRSISSRRRCVHSCDDDVDASPPSPDARARPVAASCRSRRRGAGRAEAGTGA